MIKLINGDTFSGIGFDNLSSGQQCPDFADFLPVFRLLFGKFGSENFEKLN